jgi:predicted Zn-dependent protease
MNELYEYEEKAKKMPNGKISTQELEKIHKLTDIVKNIDKIEMLEDGEGYSEDTDFMGEGRMYGVSYARGRRNVKRDSMGRYSRDDRYSQDDMSYARGGNRGNMGGRSYRGGMSYDGAKEHLMKKAEEMLEMAHDPKERRAIEKLLDELED